MDLISIIVPVYNVEKYLDRCVESIVQQTYKNLEIILVDDGSPDNCPQMCDLWAEKDKRIKVIHKPNGGLSDARNAGLAIATGEYISFIDSDDWVHCDFIKTLYDSIKNSDADIAECGTQYINSDNHILRTRSCESSKIEIDKIEALYRLVSEKGVYQTVWNKLYSKSVIQDILFEVGKYNEDEYWTYLVLDNIEKMVVINEELYYYFQRESSIMGQGYTIKHFDGLKARVERMRFLQKYQELAEFSIEQLRYDYLFHFQSALKWLNDEDQNTVTEYVANEIKQIDRLKLNKSAIPLKHKVWFALFERFPFTIARIRNKLGIGL